MDWIISQDIVLWGQRFESKGYLPQLVARLIRATTPPDTSIDFPKGADTYTGGWDGIVNASKKTSYVPEGISLWELSTDNKTKGKADKDYNKRLADSLGYDSKQCTYVYVTANKWSGKRNWKTEKEKTGDWKNVLVYDAVDIEQWLSNAPATARWFSVLIKKTLLDGIQPTEDYWNEFSIGPKCVLAPKVVTCNRDAEVSQIANFLEGKPAFLAVKATSKEEAIAFIIASVMQHEIHLKENFFSRSLVIDQVGVFKNIANNSYPLVLITRFDDMMPIYHVVSKGHHVFIALGADDNFSSKDIIDLPNLGIDLASALVESGIVEDDARKFALESGRNITILKRLLDFPFININWATPENAQKLIPALLLGRWDENRPGDKEVVSWLAGQEYQTYVDEIGKWKEDPIPFIYQIGSCWRLASPLDAWSVLAKYINKNELDKLKNSLFKILTEVKPSFELEPTQRHMASFYGKLSPYSGWLREGTSQSLILLAIYGSNLRINFPISSQEWVDEVITSLLDTTDENLWKSLNDIMPLLAEASPTGFTESIRKSIENEQKPILGMFVEDPTLITPHVYHTGLLWALEELAWFKEYLPKVTILLAKLAAHDPGGSVVNRPINSLRGIYLPWFPQTLATPEERKDVLTFLISENPEIAWHLLVMLQPSHHGVAHPTHKTRWRLFNEPAFKKGVSYQELWDMQSFVLSKLLLLAGNDEERLSTVVNSLELYSAPDQTKLLNHIADNFDPRAQKTFSIWHSLRKTLNWHRRFSEAARAYPEEVLAPYQRAYDNLMPQDVIARNLWLFQDYPEFADTNADLEKDFDGRDAKVFAKRKEAMQAIYDAFGLEKIIELADEVKESYHYGRAMASLFTEEHQVLKILNHEWLAKDIVPGALAGYILFCSVDYKIEWTIFYYNKLAELRFNHFELSNFLTSTAFTKELISFVDSQNEEIQTLYWQKIRPFLYQLDTTDKEAVIRKLIAVNRHNSAISELMHFVKEFSTDFITFVLESKREQTEDDNAFLRNHDIEYIFQEVYNRTDYDKSRYARLEWFYLPYFGYSYGRNANTQLLQDELANNPQFFVEVLKFLYKRKDEKEDSPVAEKKSDSEEEVAHKSALAHNAYTLLSAWEKIPGVDKEGNINSDFLNFWIVNARNLASEASRLEVADVHIGKILSKYPEENLDQWPPNEICEILDGINSESMKSGFKTETFNKRGSSSRGVYEGGDRERKLAEYFSNLAKKIEIMWPQTSEILSSLAKGYLFDAKRQDEEAARDSLEY